VRAGQENQVLERLAVGKLTDIVMRNSLLDHQGTRAVCNHVKRLCPWGAAEMSHELAVHRTGDVLYLDLVVERHVAAEKDPW
jgi:hypothetical protein